MSKKTQGANALVSALLLVVIFVAVNALAARMHSRWDLTENKVYTLATGLQNILQRMADSDDLVEIVVYVTNEVPGPAVHARDRLVDMAKDIEAAAGDGIEVRFVDPQESDALADEAAEYGIAPIQMMASEGSSSTIAKVYAGIVCKRAGQFEAVPQLFFSGRSGGVMLHPEAEYQIAAALLKLGDEERKTIGYLTGHQEPDLGPEESPIHAELLKVYNVEMVDTAAKGVVPEGIDLLIVRTPAGLDDRDRYAIDQFVMTGKPVIFLAPRSTANEQTGVSFVDAGLHDMLLEYGAEVQSNLLVESMKFMGGELRDQRTGQAVYRPNVVCQVDPDDPRTSRIGSVQVLIGNPVKPSDKLGARSFKALVTASPDAGSISGLQDLQDGAVAPGVAIQPLAGEATLYAVVEGPAESVFKGKEIPAARQPQPGSPQPIPPDQPFVESVAKASIVVAGFDFLMFNRYIREPRNIQLVLNTLDHLLLGEDLIQVRSRAVESRPLELLEEKDAEKLEQEIIDRYKELDPEFKLQPTTYQELSEWDEETVKRARRAQSEISDARSEAATSKKFRYYLFNFAVVPALLIVGGLMRFAWRRRTSRRVFQSAGK